MKKSAVFLILAGSLILWTACSSNSDQPLRRKSQHAQSQKEPSRKDLNRAESPLSETQDQAQVRPAPAYSAPANPEPERVYAPTRRSARSAKVRAVNPPQSPSRPTYSARVPAEASHPAGPPVFTGTAPAQTETRAATPEPVPLPDSSAPAGQSSPDLRRTPRQEEVITQQPEPVPPPPPREEKVTIPAGTELIVRTLDRISSEDARPDERFAAILDTEVTQNGKILVPANSEVTGRIVSVQQAGRVGGRAEMALELESIVIRGQHYDVRTSKITMQGENKAKEDAAKIGGGAALGAILGAITGGKKGAIIGATVGAGTGTVGAVISKGKPLRIGPESRLSFRLETPLEFVIR